MAIHFPGIQLQEIELWLHVFITKIGIQAI
jgi:hypothetical protein